MPYDLGDGRKATAATANPNPSPKSYSNRLIHEPCCCCKARGECELTCAPAVGATGYEAIQAIPTATWLGVGLGLGLGYQAIEAGHALRCIYRGIRTY